MSQKNKNKKIDPPPFSSHPIPHHQKTIPWKIKKKSHLPTLRINQTFPSNATQETNPWVSPHLK
jgi:hypothetical protein